LQPQFGPQAQAVPHWQPLRVSVLAAWQPQVQPVPGQVSHAQPFVVFVMTRSSYRVDLTVNAEECRIRAGGLDWTSQLLLLNEAAIRRLSSSSPRTGPANLSRSSRYFTIFSGARDTSCAAKPEIRAI
jgi:hypothetical protein